MKYFYLIVTGIGLLTTIYYKSKKSILIEKIIMTEKMTMTRDQSTQTLISLDRDEGILVKETILNRGDNNNSNDSNSVNNFVNKWYDIIL